MVKKLVLFLLSGCLLCCSFFVGCADNQPIDRLFLNIEYNGECVFGYIEYDIAVNKESNLIFNLYPNLLNGKGQITVSKVKIEEDNANFKIAGNSNEFLCLYLTKRQKRKKRIKITVEFSTKIINSFTRLGKADQIVNLAYFYPSLTFCKKENDLQTYPKFGDPFCESFFDITASLLVPSKMSVACGGVAEGIGFFGDKTSYLYNLKRAKTFACSLGENYSIVSKKWGNKRVNYYFYNDNEPEKRLEKIIDCICFLQSFFDYPYQVFTVAKSPYYCAGMEYPAFCVVGENESQSEYENAIIHEICHQYLPVSFYFNELKRGYLDEGLTEFLTYSYLDLANPGAKKARAEYAEKRLNEIKLKIIKEGGVFSGIMNRTLAEFYSSEEYFAVAYLKGYLLFYYIEKSGIDIFQALTNLYRKNAFSLLDEDKFINCFGKDKKRVKNIFKEIVFKGGELLLEK